MPNLKQYIEAQLKRGYSANRIKSFLTNKGYSESAVAEVDKIARSSPKKPSSPFMVFGLVILVIALIVVLYMLVGPEKNIPISKDAVRETPHDSNSFCDNYKNYNYRISCDEAANIALSIQKGTIQNIAIGPVTVFDKHNLPKKITMDMWLIDIRVTPYFDDNFNRQVNVLRVGIGLNETAITYKEVRS